MDLNRSTTLSFRKLPESITTLYRKPIPYQKSMFFGEVSNDFTQFMWRIIITKLCSYFESRWYNILPTVFIADGHYTQDSSVEMNWFRFWDTNLNNVARESNRIQLLNVFICSSNFEGSKFNNKWAAQNHICMKESIVGLIEMESATMNISLKLQSHDFLKIFIRKRSDFCTVDVDTSAARIKL